MEKASKTLFISNLDVFLGRGEDKKQVLQNINLKLEPGGLMSIVGESGCGKSTLLRATAGLYEIDGEILFGGEHIQIEDASIGFMFQQAKLYPWLTTAENIAYGLKIHDVPKKERIKKVNVMLEDIGLMDQKDQYPDELSGGMQQRVSLARSLIMEPELILMDEPFSALDFKTRREMQNLTVRIWQKYRPSILFVTHDIDEAIFMSDKVVMMERDPGRIFKTIEIPFERPRSLQMMATVEYAEIKSQILKLFLEV